MNKKIITAMKVLRDECLKNETCKTCYVKQLHCDFCVLGTNVAPCKWVFDETGTKLFIIE